jgi:hypothetical protein
MLRNLFLRIWLLLALGQGRLGLAQTKSQTTLSFSDSEPFPDSIYQVLKTARVICLGEMHGTQEPPELLLGLVNLFQKNGRKVMAGFEIPEPDMAYFRENPDDSLGVFNSTFFQIGYGDGRNNTAWLNCLNALHKKNIPICFFDNDHTQRDSTMAARILNCLSTDSSAVMITLSGNFHIVKTELMGKWKMAGYLSESLGKSVVCLNHFYEAGTLFNRTSKGLGLQTVPEPTKGYRMKNPHEIRFVFPFGPEADCDGGFFTQQVHAAYPIRYKSPQKTQEPEKK